MKMSFNKPIRTVFSPNFPILIGERKIIVFQYQEKYINYLPRAEKQISIQIERGAPKKAPNPMKSESIRRQNVSFQICGLKLWLCAIESQKKIIFEPIIFSLN